MAILAAFLNIVYFVLPSRKLCDAVGSISFPLTMMVMASKFTEMTLVPDPTTITNSIVQIASLLVLLLEVKYETLPALEIIYPILFSTIYTVYQVVFERSTFIRSNIVPKPYANTSANTINYHLVLITCLQLCFWMILCQYIWAAIDYVIHRAFKSFKQVAFYLGLVVLVNRSLKSLVGFFKRESVSFSQINP